MPGFRLMNSLLQTHRSSLGKNVIDERVLTLGARSLPGVRRVVVDPCGVHGITPVDARGFPWETGPGHASLVQVDTDTPASPCFA